MSNIINGIDYGMGYEQATKWEPGLQYFDPALRVWEESGNCENFGLTSGITYRRPLPIISQHPGAIPLEPGEELAEGECYLMRDGRLTGPMPCDGHEAFPFGVDGTPDTWRRDGSCWDNALSRNDIIARLPKVEEERVQVGTLFPKLSELAKAVLENPKIMVEVERQRKEKEIKVGDWFRHCRGAVDKCLSASELSLLTNSGGNYQRKNCAKITNPDFIALLERGANL